MCCPSWCWIAVAFVARKAEAKGQFSFLFPCRREESSLLERQRGNFCKGRLTCCWIMTSSAGPETKALIIPAVALVASFMVGLKWPFLSAKYGVNALFAPNWTAVIGAILPALIFWTRKERKKRRKTRRTPLEMHLKKEEVPMLLSLCLSLYFEGEKRKHTYSESRVHKTWSEFDGSGLLKGIFDRNSGLRASHLADSTDSTYRSLLPKAVFFLLRHGSTPNSLYPNF